MLSKNYELALFADKLMEDVSNLKDNEKKDEGEENKEGEKKVCNISLCAKWAPSENDRNDSRKHFAKKIATIIFGKEDNKKMEKYLLKLTIKKHSY